MYLCNPFGKELHQAWGTGTSDLDHDLPSSAKAWEYPHGSFWHDFLHVEEAVHRKCSSFSALTRESKHSYSYGNITGSVSEKCRGGISPKMCTFSIPKSISQICIFYISSQFPKFVFSTSQINPCVFFILSCLMKSMVLWQGLKWSWHQLPKCCWNQWPLHKVFVTVGTRSRALPYFINWAKYLHPHVPRFTKSQEMQVSHFHSIQCWTQKGGEIMLQTPISQQLQGKCSLPIKFCFHLNSAEGF